MLILSGRLASALSRIAGSATPVAMSPDALTIAEHGLQVHVWQGDAVSDDYRRLPDGWLRTAVKLAGGLKGQVALAHGAPGVVVATGPRGEQGAKINARTTPHKAAPWIFSGPDGQTAAVRPDAFKAGGPVARALAAAGDRDAIAGVWLGELCKGTDGHRMASEPAPSLAALRGVWLPTIAAKALLLLVAGTDCERLDWRWDAEHLTVQLQGSGPSSIYLCVDAKPSEAWKPEQLEKREGTPALALAVDVDALASLLGPMKGGRVVFHTDGAIVAICQRGEGGAWGDAVATDAPEGPIGAPLWSASVGLILPVLLAAKRAKLARLQVEIRAAHLAATWGEGLIMPMCDREIAGPTGGRVRPPMAVPPECLAELGLVTRELAAVGVAA